MGLIQKCLDVYESAVVYAGRVTLSIYIVIQQ
jgi:hypothetical protein